MTEALRQHCESIKEAYPEAQSALIPILHALQDTYGYVTPQAVEEAAELMAMTPAEVEGVVSFYTLFHRQAKGRFHIQVCDNLSCRLRGADQLVAHLAERWRLEPGAASPDGLFSLERVECLAACGYAPVAQVNLRYYYHLTPEKADQVLGGLADGEEARGERI
jgi:NADH-quinone oxidoreductase subunit E